MKSRINRIVLSFGILAITGASAGCESESRLDNPVEPVETAVAVPLELGDVTVGDATRAIFGSSYFSKDDSIGVTVFNSYNEAICRNVGVGYNGSHWEFREPVFVTPGEYRVCAYYPYQENMNKDGEIYVMPVDNDQPDVMAAWTWIGYSGDNRPIAGLTFDHKLVRVTLSLHKDNLYKGDGHFTSASISNDYVYIRDGSELVKTEEKSDYLYTSIGVDMCWLEDIPSLLTPAKDNPFTIHCDYILSQTSRSEVDILLPYNWNYYGNKLNFVNINVVIDGHEYLVKSLAPEWGIGKAYTYNVLLSGDEPEPYGHLVVITDNPNGDVSPWDDGGSEDLSTIDD